MNLDDLIPAIQGRNWYAVAALAVWAIVAFAKNRAPEFYYRIPDGWRWLPPVLLAAATGFTDGFASGLPWQQAAMRALFAVVTMGVGAMGLHGALAASPLKYGGGPSAVLLAIGLSLAVPTGCAGKGPDTAAMVERSAALAFNGATVALEVLTAQEVAYLDSLAKPTPAQLSAAEARNSRLHRARESLLIVRGWLEGEREGGKQALADALQALEFVADELGTQGVKIPERVTDGIRLAKLFVGLS